MGKGIIISGGEDGLYVADSVFNRDSYDDQLAILTERISALATQISEADDGAEKNSLKAQKLGYEKRKSFLENNMPEDETIPVWCADLTTDLSGDVGLIEIPGESIAFNIYPGFVDATFNLARDGQLVPTIIQTAAQAYYNLAMLPGWQKWKPTFRYAEISNLQDNLCTITFEETGSTQQSLGINQEAAIDNVEIEYMDCHGAAFADGDSVIVMFSNQDWSQPKVIGFKDNPKPCSPVVVILELYIYSQKKYIMFSLNTSSIYPLNDPDGSGIMTQPFQASSSELTEIAEYNELGSSIGNIVMNNIVDNSSVYTAGTPYDDNPSDVNEYSGFLCSTSSCGNVNCADYVKITEHRDRATGTSEDTGVTEEIVTFVGSASISEFRTDYSFTREQIDGITTATHQTSQTSSPPCEIWYPLPVNPYLPEVYYNKFELWSVEDGAWDSVGFPAAYTDSGVDESLINSGLGQRQINKKWLGENGPLEYAKTEATITVTDSLGNDESVFELVFGNGEIDPTFTTNIQVDFTAWFNNDNGCCAIADTGYIEAQHTVNEPDMWIYQFSMHYSTGASPNKFKKSALKTLTFDQVCTLFNTNIAAVTADQAYFSLLGLLS